MNKLYYLHPGIWLAVGKDIWKYKYLIPLFVVALLDNGIAAILRKTDKL